MAILFITLVTTILLIIVNGAVWGSTVISIEDKVEYMYPLKKRLVHHAIATVVTLLIWGTFLLGMYVLGQSITELLNTYL